jgi:hypothetical protein
MAGNHSYVADVTPLVPIGGDLNQDYQVVLQFDTETSQQPGKTMGTAGTQSKG